MRQLIQTCISVALADMGYHAVLRGEPELAAPLFLAAIVCLFVKPDEMETTSATGKR
jgi:hypothetical protein